MKLLRIHVIEAKTCGGLLDGFDRSFRDPTTDFGSFDPICLIGPNGSGKSQLMQLLAEIFQSVCHAVVDGEERLQANSENRFEIEYLIRPESATAPIHVMISRDIPSGKKKPVLRIQRRTPNGWDDCDLTSPETAALLPTRIVGYTSGDNETLSLPFLVSRAGYADQVGRMALDPETRGETIADTRLMLIDYGTNLEVLVTNQLFGNDRQRRALLEDARVERLHSCRCIVQLNHSAAPKPPRGIQSERKGIQLTDELEEYLDRLKRCSTCHSYDEKSETYIFDFWINEATRDAFRHYWPIALELYGVFHKLAMLNDLVIPKKTRLRIRKESRERHFAARLPEPPDEDKVFRFEQVKFISRLDGNVVDYVSLSDGEHQLTQLLGMMMMQESSGILFLLDEPESHFNPGWRVKCISMLMDLPTNTGRRCENGSPAAEQECLITTHAPFIPSDMRASRVFIFTKDSGKAVAQNPAIETYGTTFDSIIEECFGVVPPISNWSSDQIKSLKNQLSQLQSLSELNDEERARLTEKVNELGHTVQKALLVDRLLQLQEASES